MFIHQVTALIATLLCMISFPLEAQSQCNDDYATCTSKKTFPVSTNLDEYYASTEGKTGKALKDSLNSIIKGHHRYTYKCVWTALGEIDKDDRGDDHVRGIYTQRPIARLNRSGCYLADGSGNRNYDKDAWNREHLFPKSHGFPKQSQHAYTDIHHLVPADSSVNTDRSTDDFKDGGQFEVCKDDDLFCCRECKEDNTNKTWEPPTAAKGTIARMMLYMDVRYEGNDIDESKTPDLKLVDRSTQTKNPDPDLTYYPELGYISNLLKWHCDNPVSDRERDRNDAVQSWQGNRNPFVDRPELAKEIWNDPKWDSLWEGCKSVPPKKTPLSLWINEFHYDNKGLDVDEFIEIGCNQEINVKGYQIILFNGSNGLPYKVVPLSGICYPSGDQFIVKKVPLQNGPDGIALFDPKHRALEFITYEGPFMVVYNGSLLRPNEIGVSESSKTATGLSLQKTGSGCLGKDFEWKSAPEKRSPGMVNAGQTISC